MLITVFDPEGNPHTVEPVDAREYLKSGHYTAYPKDKADKAEVEKADEEAKRIADEKRTAPAFRMAPAPEIPVRQENTIADEKENAAGRRDDAAPLKPVSEMTIEPDSEDNHKATNVELREQLRAAGIIFDPHANKAELQALLAAGKRE